MAHTASSEVRLARGLMPPRVRSASLEDPRLPRMGSASLEVPSRVHLLPHACTGIQCSDTAEPRHYAPGNHAPPLFRQLPRESPSPPLWGTVRRGRCQLRDTGPSTLVRLTRRALEGGPAAPSSPFLVTPQGQTVTSGRRERHPRRCQSCAAIPAPCYATLSTATTTSTLLSTRGRDAATPATAPRTDHRQRLPRARLKTPRSTITPPPSKSPLFKHRTRHDAVIGARFARTVVNSTALYAIPPHVAK
jgi:hypothetical protein